MSNPFVPASNLHQYTPNPGHVIQYEPLQLNKNLTYIEEPVRILERMDRPLQPIMTLTPTGLEALVLHISGTKWMESPLKLDQTRA